MCRGTSCTLLCKMQWQYKLKSTSIFYKLIWSSSHLGILSLIFSWHSFYNIHFEWLFHVAFCSWFVYMHCPCERKRAVAEGTYNRILEELMNLFGLLSSFCYVLLYQFVAHSMQFSNIIVSSFAEWFGLLFASRQCTGFFSFIRSYSKDAIE